MEQTFDYYYVEQAQDSIHIEDIGNCILTSFNDDGDCYILIIKTLLGITRVLEYGPYVDGGFPTFVNQNFLQFDYSEKRIIKCIDKFLKRPKITQVIEEDDLEDVLEMLVPLVEYFNF